MSAPTSAPSAASGSQPSALAPLGQPAFAMLWVATVLSNIGTWMNDVGAGWLMTTLSPSPVMVAAVQATTTMPVFLFALLAGAVADIVDRRRLLLVANVLMTAVAGMLALLVSLEMMTPLLLLVFTFLLGSGAAFVAPAWQAIVPSLVPRKQLSAAIALNSTGVNVSRAIGPALAGFLIVAVGLGAPFALNALSFVGIIAALVWWRPPAQSSSRLPPEKVGAAIIVGLRYAFNSGPLRATLIRAGAFFLFASALWAMLPLVARDVLSGGPTLYGLLLASVGAGAVLAAFVMPAIKSRLGPNATVAAGSIGTAGVLALFALVRDPKVAIAAAGLAGVCWIGVLSSLYVSVQTALPDWVRARGLSIFLTVFFGAMSFGSLIWGQVAALSSIETSLLAAAAGVVAFVPLTWSAKLSQGEGMDLAPSMHWPEPIVSEASSRQGGPAMIRVTYQIAEPDQPRFFALMDELATARRRNGGYDWSLMQDAENPESFVETWFEETWVDHLRHHERMTGADQKTQAEILALHRGPKGPAVTHFVAPERNPLP